MIQVRRDRKATKAVSKYISCGKHVISLHIKSQNHSLLNSLNLQKMSVCFLSTISSDWKGDIFFRQLHRREIICLVGSIRLSACLGLLDIQCAPIQRYRATKEPDRQSFLWILVTRVALTKNIFWQIMSTYLDQLWPIVWPTLTKIMFRVYCTSRQWSLSFSNHIIIWIYLNLWTPLQPVTGCV